MSSTAATVSNSPKPKPKVPARPSVDKEDSPSPKPKPKVPARPKTDATEKEERDGQNEKPKPFLYKKC